MPDVTWINERFVPPAEAVVSIDDRGFQFGDGIYEVVRTYKGRPFELDAHLARLERSAKALDLPQTYSRTQWTWFIAEGLTRAAFRETKIYIQLTRGVAPRDHAYPDAVGPTAVMTLRELRPLDAAVHTAGVQAMTTDDIRWGRCDIKSINLLANVLAKQRAKEARMFETILVKGGHVTEGAVSNVMAVQRGTITTAPEGPRILSGITRAVVLELARKEGLPVREQAVSLPDLYQADEVFLTGTTVEVLGVVRVDGRTIGTGRPGALTQRLAAAFAARTG